MRRFRLMILIAFGLECAPAARADSPAPAKPEAPRVVHLFVALADNDSQGIVPVPKKIGNGEDPDLNLYWGNEEGARGYFKASADWKLVASRKKPSPPILERLVFKHKEREVYLVADGYRGRCIAVALKDFFEAAAGGEAIAIEAGAEGPKLEAGGKADLVAFLGHNGLMDNEVAAPAVRKGGGKPAIVLCCASRQFFEKILAELGARPILLTNQLMYPAACVLKGALDGWMRGESAERIRERASEAYAKNQNISLKSAKGMFAAKD